MLFERFFRLFKKRQPQVIETEPTAPPVPPPTDATAQESKPAPPPSRNPRKELGDQCYKIGYDAAIASGAPKPNPAHIMTLEARAAAIAHTAHIQPSEAKDQRRAARLLVLDEDRDRQTIDTDRVAGYAVTAKDELARLGPSQEYPLLSAVFLYSAVVGLSISTAPTFHDLLPGLDPILKWFVGGGCAVGISLFIVHGILPSGAKSKLDKAKAAFRSKLQHNTAKAGYLLGGALGLVRFAGVRTGQDAVLAIGLTLAELGAVWLVEKRARKLEADREIWSAHEEARGKAEDKVRSTQEEHERRQGLLKATVDEIAEIDEAFEHDHSMSDAKMLVLIATSSVVSGYHDGIAHNYGKRGGVQ